MERYKKIFHPVVMGTVAGTLAMSTLFLNALGHPVWAVAAAAVAIPLWIVTKWVNQID